MNTEDFCSYEQALALKKLGFREECLYYYSIKKNVKPNRLLSNDLITTKELYRCNNSNGDIELPVDAPTLAQAQKWLRKEKNWSVEAFFERVINGKQQWSCFLSNILDNEQQNQFPIYWESYEEALSAGITECLKLLDNNRWGAKLGEYYYYFDKDFNIVKEVESGYDYKDNILWCAGNYFKTEEEAKEGMVKEREKVEAFYKAHSNMSLYEAWLEYMNPTITEK